MSRSPASAALTVLLSAALLSGCGTGLKNLTYQETGREDGAVADVGGPPGIAVRNLHVAPPDEGSTFPLGGSVTVLGGLVNNGMTADALVGAGSDVAGTVALVVDGVPTSSVPVAPLGAAATGWALRLDNLSRGLHAGQYIDVTLVFEHAGRVTLRVPVRAGDNGFEDREPSKNWHEE